MSVFPKRKCKLYGFYSSSQIHYIKIRMWELHWQQRGGNKVWLKRQCCVSARFHLNGCSHCHCFLSLSSQPEGATSEKEAIHLSEEGLPGSRSGSRVIGVNPGVNSSGSTWPLQPREQNYNQGKMWSNELSDKTKTKKCSKSYKVNCTLLVPSHAAALQ